MMAVSTENEENLLCFPFIMWQAVMHGQLRTPQARLKLSACPAKGSATWRRETFILPLLVLCAADEESILLPPTMRTTFFACAAAALAFCKPHVTGFTVEGPLTKRQVSSTTLQVKRDPIKMPSQTPMFPYKVTTLSCFLSPFPSPQIEKLRF